MEKKKLLVVVLLALFLAPLFQVVPAKAWVISPTQDDYKFELYGPHVGGILIKMYANEEAEWTAMDNDELDFEDWPLTPAWINKWHDDPRFMLVNYGGEAGYFILDINKNNNETLPDGKPNPAYIPGLGNPCSVLEFRQALAYLVNRTYIVETITHGLGLPMWTPVPTYMTTYVHPEIKPGGTLEALTYGGMTGDISAAAAKLDAGGFKIGPDGWRYWDKNGNNQKDPNEDFSIIFYARSDSLERLAFADNLKLKLESEPIKIHVDYRPRDRKVCSDDVFGAKIFHLYTGGWIFIGPDPDYLYDTYHSSMYWHPGKPPNYGNGKDPILDQLAENIKFAPNATYAIQQTLLFQERFAALAWNIPLWCASGVKAFRKVPVNAPTGPEWDHVVNQAGFGVNSWWTFLNLIQKGVPYPDTIVTYGFKVTTIDWLNPVYAEWYWDWEVIGKIYDGCAARNPYSLGEFIPQLAKSWEEGTWVDPIDRQTKSKVRITLKEDVFWQDGTPVTTADVFYTFIECVDTLLAKGLPPPWWYPTVQYFKSFYLIDAYNVEILLDVLSTWAVGWVIGTVVIPKHIWKPIVDASTVGNPIVHKPQPDPHCIGTGPYRFVEYVPEVRVVLAPNTPGSIVHDIESPGYYQYEPVRIDIDLPGKFSAGTRTFDVVVNNLVQTESMTANITIKIDGAPVSTQTGVVIPAGKAYQTSITYNFPWGKHVVEVSVDYTLTFKTGRKVTKHMCWVTIPEDMFGSTYYDDIGFPDYPYKSQLPTPEVYVDYLDIGPAARAFGSYPGHKRWNPVCDLVNDFFIDYLDINPICRKFGWSG